MAVRTESNRAYYLRKKMENLTDEEKIKEIKDLSEADKLALYRAKVLKYYRDVKLTDGWGFDGELFSS